MPFPRASQALSRFTVLDLTRVRSGPTCVRQLADWGANVIKIETPPHLVEGEGPGGPREGSDFQNLQRNKRGMTLDLKSPQGLAAFKRLVEKADVVVENFRPDVKDRLGIDYESSAQDQQAHHPRQHFRFRPGRALRQAARLRPDRARHGRADVGHRPAGPRPDAGRHSGRRSLAPDLFCALGILTALLEREVSGEGQWVSTSLLQAQIFMLDFQASRFLTDGRGGQAGRQQSPDLDSDRRVQDQGRLFEYRRRRRGDLGAFLQRGRPSGMDRLADYKTGKLRLQNRDALNAEIDKATATKSSAEWVEIFNKVGVPCGPIYSIDQVFADPQVKHLGIAQESARSDGSRLGLVGQPFKLSRTPSKIAARPPNLGEHTDEILTEFGFGADEIRALHESKAV